MNRLTGSSTCRVCRRWMEGDYNRAVSDVERESVVRQCRNGMCDRCQRARQAAAQRYMIAADHARILSQLAIAAGIEDDALPVAYREAVRDAEIACEKLMMWPRRSGRYRPDRFRETGDRAA